MTFNLVSSRRRGTARLVAKVEVGCVWSAEQKSSGRCQALLHRAEAAPTVMSLASTLPSSALADDEVAFYDGVNGLEHHVWLGSVLRRAWEGT